MEEKDYILYVGQSPGKDDVDNYHKKDSHVIPRIK